MKKSSLIILVLLFAIAIPANAGTNSSECYALLQEKRVLSNISNLPKSNWIEGEILFKLVEFQGTLNDAPIRTAILTYIKQRFGLSDVSPLLSVRAQKVVGQIYRARLPVGTTTLQAAAALRGDSAIAWAEPIYLYYTDDILPNDPGFNQQWHLHNVGQTGGTIDADIDAPEAWQITTGNPSVVIAIIDTGVDWDHPDLAANIWINQGEWGDGKESNGIDDDGNGFIDDYHGWDFVSVDASSVYLGEDPGPPDNNPMDFHGHGTHCAGIASAVGNNEVGITGVSWGCKIMPVRAGYKDSLGRGVLRSDDIVAAINYAADNEANVISMSFRGPYYSEAERTVIEYAFGCGVTLIAAAGNSGSYLKGYPAGYDEVIAVAATDENDRAAWFTSWGSWIDVAAPGVNIYSTYFDNSYATFSGTSMASPLVAGITALCLSYNPDLTNAQIAQVLRSTCDFLNASRYVGIGRVNAESAVNKQNVSMALLAQYLDDSVVDPPLEIYGKADGESYTLSVGQGPYPATWTEVSTGGRVIDGLLGTWDMVGTHPGDIYCIRLIVDDNLPQRAEDRAVLWLKTHFTDIGANLVSVCFSSLAWGDYDNDGDLDLAVAGMNSGFFPTTKIYQNNAGVFVKISTDLAQVMAGALAWGDYDNDGDLDLALAGSTIEGGSTRYVAKIYRNDGNNVFTDIQTNLRGVEQCSLAWGDYDNDGDLDLAIAGRYFSKIYRNDKNDIFTDVQAELTGVSSCSLAWGDYDNDGDLDLALSGSLGGGSKITKIYRNEGGKFVDIGAQLVGVRHCALAWADFDNDGDMDLAVAGDETGTTTYGIPTAKVYRNDGNSIFTDINAGLLGVLECSLAWGDYDNDGDVDLALAGWPVGWGDPVSEIYRNNGDGTFTSIGPLLTPTYISLLQWGDFDGDGDLDIALSGSTSAGALFNPVCKIYRNDEAFPINTPPTAPTGLTSIVEGNGHVTLSWQATTDLQTPSEGLSYNLRIGTTPGGGEVLSGMAGADGLRRVPSPGNAHQRLSWTIHNLVPGDYYWSVQAIDTAFAGSMWATEQTLRWLYVDRDATGTGNGKTWVDAYNYLQDALATAQAGDHICVAEGTYKPDATTAHPAGTGNRVASFQFINSVAIYGGYAGVGEHDPDVRDIATYETILSGDINMPDVSTDNSYHIVTGSGINGTAILDGFTVTSGNANGLDIDQDSGGGMYNESGSPTVKNCTFRENFADYGGGIYNGQNSCPILLNCTFSGNSARSHGGGIYNYNSSPRLTNCRLRGNSADFFGGAIYNILSEGDSKLTNCIFSGNFAVDGGAIFNLVSSLELTGCTLGNNSATRWGGGILQAGGNLKLTNTILWGNSDNEGFGESAQIYVYSGGPVINYCCVQGWTGTLGGSANIGNDPMFVDVDGPDGILGTEDDNLRLQPYSPCIDVGDNTAVPGSITTDLDGHPRITDGDCNDTDIVDIGTYEFAWAYNGDFDGTCDVDFADFSIFGSAWLTHDGDAQWNPTCDISVPADNSIDMLDLVVFAQHWLEGNTP